MKNRRNDMCNLPIFFLKNMSELNLSSRTVGVRGIALELFDNYINNRVQSVSIDEILSEEKKTNVGVAQGSKLGPLLFIIYMNDIFELKLNGKLQLYANDVSLTYIANEPNSLYKMINEDLEESAIGSKIIYSYSMQIKPRYFFSTHKKN